MLKLHDKHRYYKSQWQRIDHVLIDVVFDKIVQDTKNTIIAHKPFINDKGLPNRLYNPRKHEFYIHMQNLQNIRYNNVLPIADPLTMSLSFIIKREHNTYSGYAVAGVKASNIPFRSLRRRVSISLMHRMHAIIEWFQQSLENRQAL